MNTTVAAHAALVETAAVRSSTAARRRAPQRRVRRRARTPAAAEPGAPRVGRRLRVRGGPGGHPGGDGPAAAAACWSPAGWHSTRSGACCTPRIAGCRSTTSRATARRARAGTRSTCTTPSGSTLRATRARRSGPQWREYGLVFTVRRGCEPVEDRCPDLSDPCLSRTDYVRRRIGSAEGPPGRAPDLEHAWATDPGRCGPPAAGPGATTRPRACPSRASRSATSTRTGRRGEPPCLVVDRICTQECSPVRHVYRSPLLRELLDCCDVALPRVDHVSWESWEELDGPTPWDDFADRIEVVDEARRRRRARDLVRPADPGRDADHRVGRDGRRHPGEPGRLLDGWPGPADAPTPGGQRGAGPRGAARGRRRMARRRGRRPQVVPGRAASGSRSRSGASCCGTSAATCSTRSRRGSGADRARAARGTTWCGRSRSASAGRRAPPAAIVSRTNRQEGRHEQPQVRRSAGARAHLDRARALPGRPARRRGGPHGRRPVSGVVAAAGAAVIPRLRHRLRAGGGAPRREAAGRPHQAVVSWSTVTACPSSCAARWCSTSRPTRAPARPIRGRWPS